jgi:phosphoglucosamine mutase
MGKYFGTDGVRGTANKDLDVFLAYRIGLAAADALVRYTHKKAKIIIGKDTRISGDMFESAISAGICAAGCDVVLAGVVPTPAVAYLVKECGFDAGVMISASHNHAFDNGIKIFNSEGFKLSDELEDKIEAAIDRHENIELKTGGFIGTIARENKLINKYSKHVAAISGVKNNKKILIDCANGSASETAAGIFENADIINNEPDGLNINKECGSTHLANLIERVKSGGYDLGLAFDGDADRCLAVDETGALICGDKIICILAEYLKKDAVAVTKLANMGLHEFCGTRNISVEETDVGDRFVLERMLEKDIKLGGEQSGHIIALDYAATGDGQIAAVLILEILNKYDKKASEIFNAMRVYPQVALNVRAENGFKQKIMQDEQLIETVRKIQAILNGTGRVLLRASGTEPLIRIMIEGEDIDKITGYAKVIEYDICERLGRLRAD